MKKVLRPSLVIIATLLGNTLEWFDYLAFAFLAPVFAVNFFPGKDSWHALFAVLIGFSLGGLFRPVGALIFGFLGDRFGRKFALIGSVLLMTFPTLVIGLLPTYAQIGMTAVILLAAMRLIQGVATGGEFPCSMTFLVEYAPPRFRSFFGSFAYFGMILGVLLGGADYFVLDHYFSDSIVSGGWRSVYLFGALMGFAALFMRSKLHETHPFQHLKEVHEIQKDPLLSLIRKHKLNILKVFGLQVLQTSDFNLLISFSIVYFTSVLNLSYVEAAKLNLTFIATLLIAIPLAGWISNSVNPKKMLIWAAIGHILFAVPLYWMLQIEGFRFIALIGLGLLSGFYMAPTVVMYCELFPTKVRLSGVALGYNLSVGFVGSFAPVTALWLIHHTGYKTAPGFFIMGAACVALFTLKTVPFLDVAKKI